MEVLLSALADHALALPAGKFDTMGLGVDSLPASSFPYTHPVLAAILKVRAGAHDDIDQQTITFKAVDPGGIEFHPRYSFVVKPEEAGQMGSNLVYNMTQIVFRTPGKHSFLVDINGVHVVTLELDVYQRATAEADDSSDPLTAKLRASFEAEASGDTETSWRILHELAAEFPNSSEVRNNLGFLLLRRGDGSGALRELDRAKEIGYRYPEILSMNRGCALFLLGRHSEAAQAFVELLATTPTSANSLLNAVSDGEIQEIHVLNTGDFVALAALNAAWSYLLTGAVSEAGKMANIAGAGEYTFSRSHPSYGVFAKLSTGLGQKVAEANRRG